MVCKNCKKEYSKKEVIRVFGDVWWVGYYCSAKCFTASNAAQHHAHQTPESLAKFQAVINASALEQSDGDTPPAQAQVA